MLGHCWLPLLGKKRKWLKEYLVHFVIFMEALSTKQTTEYWKFLVNKKLSDEIQSLILNVVWILFKWGLTVMKAFAMLFECVLQAISEAITI